MCSERPYRKGIPVRKVLDVIRAEAGKTLDEDAVAALVHIVTRQPATRTGQSPAPAVAPNSVGVEL
jgi:HD-GYP domain-containing protein (c-di-GMP phosphodiesterase class II)